MLISGFTTLLLITTPGVILQNYRFFCSWSNAHRKAQFLLLPQCSFLLKPPMSLHQKPFHKTSQNQEFFKLSVGMNFLNPHMFFPIFVHGFSHIFHVFFLVFPVFSLVFPVFAPLQAVIHPGVPEAPVPWRCWEVMVS